VKKNGLSVKFLIFWIIVLFTLINILPIIYGNTGITSFAVAKDSFNAPTVVININPYEEVYEGDIIDCDITGSPTFFYWQINNQSHHTTFYEDDPVIFDPEPTPLDTSYVNLTVYAENENGGASDTVKVIIKRIYFGDIHWHSELSNGHHNLNNMYKNAIEDNYLDFASCTDHGFLVPLFKPFEFYS